MAITFVGSNIAIKAGAASGTSTVSLTGLTGGSSATAPAGSLVIAIFATGSTADRALAITDGSGNYTLIDSERYANGSTTDTNFRVAYKFMGGTPDTTTTFGATGNNADAGCMAVFVFEGVDPGTPLDVAAVGATGTGTGRADPASIQPTTTGAVILVAGAGATAAGAVFTSSDLSNFRSNTSPDSNDAMLGAGTFAWSSGAFNPAQFGGGTTNAGDSWAAMSVALRPAPPVANAEPDDATHAHAADASSGTTHAVSAPADAAHGNSTDASTAVAHAAASPADASHGHTADEATCTPHSATATAEPDNATHGHSADASSSVAHAVAAPADGTHGHSAEQPTAAARFSAFPSDAGHAHAADASTVITHAVAVPEDATHGHTAEQPTAGARFYAEPDGSVHNHAADESTITARVPVSPADALHGHTAESPEVTGSSPGTAEPADATHDHATGQAQIIAKAVVAPADAGHGHLAEVAAVFAEAFVTPDEALNGHSAESPSAEGGEATIITVPPERTSYATAVPRVSAATILRL